MAKIFSFFGKKGDAGAPKVASAKPAASPSPAAKGAPQVVKPGAKLSFAPGTGAGNAPTAPMAGRRRITQRISVGVPPPSGAPTGEAGAAGRVMTTQKITLPSARASSGPAPSAPSNASAAGSVELPLSLVLPLLPDWSLVGDSASLLTSYGEAHPVALPLASVLPMLPSGKIEFTLRDLSQWLPAGLIRPAEELGEYLETQVILPLAEVVVRIPPEALALRADQKSVDASIVSMDDPFSEEKLRAAAEARAADAAAASQADAGPSGASPQEPSRQEPTSQAKDSSEAHASDSSGSASTEAAVKPVVSDAGTVQFPPPPPFRSTTGAGMPPKFPAVSRATENEVTAPIPVRRSTFASLGGASAGAETLSSEVTSPLSDNPAQIESVSELWPPSSAVDSTSELSEGVTPGGVQSQWVEQTDPKAISQEKEAEPDVYDFGSGGSDVTVGEVSEDLQSIDENQADADVDLLEEERALAEWMRRQAQQEAGQGAAEMAPAEEDASDVFGGEATNKLEEQFSEKLPGDSDPAVPEVSQIPPGESSESLWTKPAPGSFTADKFSTRPIFGLVDPAQSASAEPVSWDTAVKSPGKETKPEESADFDFTPSSRPTESERADSGQEESDTQVVQAPVSPPTFRVDGDVSKLNRADKQELMLLPGCTEEWASKIIARRQIQGGFERVEDLASIPGLPTSILHACGVSSVLLEEPPEAARRHILELLSLPADATCSFKEVCVCIASWPMIQGCVIAGGEGLPIAYHALDQNLAMSLSAFSPKVVRNCSSLMMEIGVGEVDEMHLPMRGNSLFIYKNEDIYLVIVGSKRHLPNGLVKLIRAVVRRLKFLR